jgi:hypothetical protein
MSITAHHRRSVKIRRLLVAASTDPIILLELNSVPTPVQISVADARRVRNRVNIDHTPVSPNHLLNTSSGRSCIHIPFTIRSVFLLC